MAVAASGRTIRFLGVSKENLSQSTSLRKEVTSKYISKSQGGIISLDSQQGGFYLQIPGGSIDYSKMVTMEYDEQNNQGFTDLVFGPHGTQFSSPAILEFKVGGVDLTGVDPDKVKFYYVNDNGHWEEMKVAGIYVSVAAGVVKVSGAKLSHFSRYAVAAE